MLRASVNVCNRHEIVIRQSHLIYWRHERRIYADRRSTTSHRLSVKGRLMRQTLTLKLREAIPFIAFRDDERVKISDYPIIRSISPFHAVTTVSRDYRVPIRSRPGGGEKEEKKREEGRRARARTRSHPGSDRNDLNARERGSRGMQMRVRTGHADEMIYSSWRREILPERETRGEAGNSLWRNPVARHASVSINVTPARAILTD